MGLLAILFFFLTTALPLQAQETIVRRAAFDIGSASIKCTVADVDIATGRVVEIVKEFAQKVDFAEDLARSYDGNLSKDILTKGQAVLAEMKQKALALQARQFSAVGETTFQIARNGRAYLVTLEEILAIPCRLISKQQASLLNYQAVRMHLKASEDTLLVWDIGGDTQRITTRNRDRSMTFYVDAMASVSFKNTIIKLIQGKDINTVTTPNPMTKEQVRQALKYARAHAESNVPRDLADRIRSGAMTVMGIGGVHYYSIPETLGEQPKTFTRAQVAAALEKWTNMPDSAFADEYADTRLTNLILVLAYMDALHIASVTPLKANEALGLLVSPEYW